jgi:hypothetical protein
MEARSCDPRVRRGVERHRLAAEPLHLRGAQLGRRRQGRRGHVPVDPFDVGGTPGRRIERLSEILGDRSHPIAIEFEDGDEEPVIAIRIGGVSLHDPHVVATDRATDRREAWDPAKVCRLDGTYRVATADELPRLRP